MKNAKIVFDGDLFIDAIKAVSRFPSVGNFVDSEKINFEVADEVATITAFGVVVSRVRVPAGGACELISVDERPLVPYASTVCSPKHPVHVTITASEILFKSRGRELSFATIPGTKVAEINPGKTKKIVLTELAARNLTYLAGIAMADTSKPELNCVLVEGGMAIACNQKTMVVVACPILNHEGHTALPLPLLKGLKMGDVLFPLTEATILEAGVGAYMMPAPTHGQEKFPLKLVKVQRAKAVKGVFSFKGDRFFEALEECSACLGNVSRMEVVLSVKIENGKMVLSAKNGGVKFVRSMVIESTYIGEFNLPLEEVMLSGPLFKNQDTVSVAVGANGETILSFEGGWFLYPSYKAS